jgi:3-methyladenine DNA glycosylase AlkD
MAGSDEPQTAARVVERLHEVQSDDELRKIHRYFKTGPGEYGEGDVFIGVRMGTLFDITKDFLGLPLTEVEVLLEDPVHEMRAAAAKVMARQAGAKRASDEQRQDLYDLYLRRHDRIDSWDIVDLAAPTVVGGYLYDLEQPRDVLYDLAVSASQWERRTAMYSCITFQRHDDLDDTWALAEVLLHDGEDLVHKVVGAMLRGAGTKDRDRLLAFLDEHAAEMPRTMLTTAMEHLDPRQKAHYRASRSR